MDPDGLTSWLGYFLFHDRFPMSFMSITVLVMLGWWTRGLADRVRTARKTPEKSSEPSGR